MGDAVVETGVFFEAANFAVLRRLPVLFLCENNLYSVYSPLSVRQPPGRSLVNVAQGIGLETRSGDGNDVRASHELIADAADCLRRGAGPQFVELATYRWREHCGPLYDNDIGYRTVAEFEAWKERDPIRCFEELLRSEGAVDAAWLSATRDRISDEIDAAFDFAVRSPFPHASDRFADLYGGRETRS